MIYILEAGKVDIFKAGLDQHEFEQWSSASLCVRWTPWRFAPLWELSARRVRFRQNKLVRQLHKRSKAARRFDTVPFDLVHPSTISHIRTSIWQWGRHLISFRLQRFSALNHLAITEAWLPECILVRMFAGASDEHWRSKVSTLTSTSLTSSAYWSQLVIEDGGKSAFLFSREAHRIRCTSYELPAVECIGLKKTGDNSTPHFPQLYCLLVYWSIFTIDLNWFELLTSFYVIYIYILCFIGLNMMFC